MKQTYNNYYKEYFAGKGKANKRKAENEYRARLRLMYPKAKNDVEVFKMHKEARAKA